MRPLSLQRWSACCLIVTAPAMAATFEVATDLPPGFPKVKRVRQVTHGPQHHFFGYYGIFPWDPSGRYLACLESDFADRLVESEETLRSAWSI